MTQSVRLEASYIKKLLNLKLDSQSRRQTKQNSDCQVDIVS